MMKARPQSKQGAPSSALYTIVCYNSTEAYQPSVEKVPIDATRDWQRLSGWQTVVNLSAPLESPRQI